MTLLTFVKFLDSGSKNETKKITRQNFKDYLKKYVHGDEGRIVAIEGKKG